MILSIIIVSYNTKEITRNCLNSIYESNLKLDFEIILVDNASTDGSPEMVETEFPEVILIKNPENRMFAKANNQGIKIARGKYVLLLNSDTLISEGNIEKLVDFLEQHPKAGCVGPRVLNMDGSFQFEASHQDSIWSSLCTVLGIINWPIGYNIKKRLLPQGYRRFLMGVTRQVGWCSGSSFMIQKAIGEKIGFLDEDLFFYGEEVEWCYRARKNSYEVWALPSSTIYHLHGASVESYKKTNTINLIESNRIPNYLQMRKKTIGIYNEIICNLIYITLLPFPMVFLKLIKSIHYTIIYSYWINSFNILKYILKMKRK